MDWLFITLGIIFILLGIIGSIVPVLPGPPFSFLALLLLQFKGEPSFTWKFIIIWAVITAVVTILDYVFPTWGTKKYGGSKLGIIGCFAGFVIGIFFGPVGIVIGPFIGALLGEVVGGTELQKALKPALGSFIGFLVGTVLKLVASLVMAFYFFKNL